MCSYSKIHEWQTRLALIKPNADRSACLELNLVVVDLVDLNTGAVVNHDTIIQYDALSYAWGTAPPSVECICDGDTILLRENLDSALKYLRRPHVARYVWIDFLCINQEDLIEKAVQIPRMRSIYAKASTVIVWLGESVAIKKIILHCKRNCGPNVEILFCSRHKKRLWKSILDYPWFRRTWVRQEVFAAQSLNICSPYFSATWELFTEPLRAMGGLDPGFSHQAVQNLKSLDQMYSSRELRLLDLLKQGKGFQASVPHDHVFSVLGMMSTPKHNTKRSISVTYDKNYEEICGDVTRYIIRESRSISILKICPAQGNKTYAFSWPAIEVPHQIPGEIEPEIPIDEGDEFVRWFDVENPIREVGESIPLKNITCSSISHQSVSVRPLVLYGRTWGTLTSQLDWDMFYDFSWRPNPVSAYSLNHDMERDVRTESHRRGDVDEYREVFIYRRGLIRSVQLERRPQPPVTLTEFEDRVKWECRGNVRQGDIFVSLEPGPRNVILRKCLQLDNLFEVVGWGGKMQGMKEMERVKRLPIIDETAYHMADVMCEVGVREDWYANEAPGPRQRFEIR